MQRRLWILGTIIVSLSWAVVPSPAEDDPPAPALAPIEDLPPLLETPPPPPENLPILVIPGLRAPSVPPTQRQTGVNTPTLDGSAGGLPPLIGPAEMPEAASPPARLPQFSNESAPLTLESVPGASPSLSAEETPSNPPSPKPPSVTDRTPRRRGLFGLFRLGPAPALRSADRNTPVARVRVEPRSDPAADAALKRRIEQQVEEAVGDRVRGVEVRVVDRRVAIRARVPRFWQRRGVRRQLESLPALIGYRADIDVTD